MKFSPIVAAALISCPLATAWETCTKFEDIYTDGKDLCERMWDDAFKVVDDSAEAGYTMWFFDMQDNPNDRVTRDIFGDNTTVNQCHLQYFHKDVPGPEDDSMRECHPWKNKACCDSTTVTSSTQLNEAYGEGYQWDRCGPLSAACERFFVMEACFYECEPAAGLFRKHRDPDQPDYNEWQMHQMPIKASFCNAWYEACRQDSFCGDGSYFACAASYESAQEAELAKEQDTNRKLGISLAVVGSVGAILAFFACFLVSRERSGEPVFVQKNAEAS